MDARLNTTLLTIISLHYWKVISTGRHSCQVITAGQKPCIRTLHTARKGLGPGARSVLYPNYKFQGVYLTCIQPMDAIIFRREIIDFY